MFERIFIFAILNYQIKANINKLWKIYSLNYLKQLSSGK